MEKWRCVVCWISKATRAEVQARARARRNTPRSIQYLLLFHGKRYKNAPQCHVIHTVTVLFSY
jgi:hypothetical protein